ncbi:MAG: bifunctional DNA primase/polymerase [bacterium]|nr:bifunctional DNA primase/polymerase [bacterium]
MQYAARLVLSVWALRIASRNGFCKSPGKHPIGALVNKGMDDATIDPAIIRRWWSAMPDAGIGINLGRSELVCIDQDPRNGSIWTMEILQMQHGELESEVFAWTQGGGTHHVFTLPSGIPTNLPGRLGDGVDVKRNGYIVVEPTMGPLGAYTWDEESNPLKGAYPSPLPDWIRNLAAPPVSTAVASVASRYATQSQLDELRDALSYLDSDDRDRWVKFGMALRPLGAEGWKLWDDWSKKSDKYSGQDANKTWTSFKPVGAVNFETIFMQRVRRVGLIRWPSVRKHLRLIQSGSPSCWRKSGHQHQSLASSVKTPLSRFPSCKRSLIGSGACTNHQHMIFPRRRPWHWHPLLGAGFTAVPQLTGLL